MLVAMRRSSAMVARRASLLQLPSRLPSCSSQLSLGINSHQRSFTTRPSPYIRIVGDKGEEEAEEATKRKGVKRTTGLTGLAVVPNAREVLTGLYCKFLVELNKLPPHLNTVRTNKAEALRQLKILEENEEVGVIEELIGNGRQLEEIIVEVQRKIEFVPALLEEKPWDVSPHKRVPIFHHLLRVE